MLSVLIGVLIICVVGAICFWAIEKFVNDRRSEDGCELVWQQVETVEGDVIDQCVAYCPWQ
jgi:hypothetical protein